LSTRLINICRIRLGTAATIASSERGGKPRRQQPGDMQIVLAVGVIGTCIRPTWATKLLLEDSPARG